MSTSRDLWLETYYPIDVITYKDKIQEESQQTQMILALEHSLRKWEGLQPDVLREYRFDLTMTDVIDEYDRLVITANGYSCMLCELYYSYDSENCIDLCDKCPLAIARDGVPCTMETKTEPRSPWFSFRAEKNPAPMYSELLRATDLAVFSVSLAAWLRSYTLTNQQVQGE